jgi:hypothetical protein
MNAPGSRLQSAQADFVPFQPRASNPGTGGIVDSIRTATIVRRSGSIAILGPTMVDGPCAGDVFPRPA